MACKDCYTGCGQIYSDKCIKYTGPEIPLLGICTGDSLSAFEASVVEKLESLVDGTGIDLSSVTLDCAFISNILGSQDKDLVNVLQTLISASCTLRELVQDIQDEINTTYSYDFKCVTVGGTQSTADIIQGIINKLCALNTSVTTIQSDFVTKAGLCTAVQACLTSATADFSSRMVPYSILPYYGSLTNFDSSGKGLSANGFNKIYLCNGNNGTPDLRGATLIGATAGVPGAAYPQITDPTITGINPAKGELLGETKHTLIVEEMPTHSHTVNDPGHSHKFDGLKNAGHPGGSSQTNLRDYSLLDTQSSQTGISINSTGNSQPHNNIQPSKAVHFIIFLP